MFAYDDKYIARYVKRAKPEDKKIVNRFQKKKIGLSMKYRAEITKTLAYMSEYFTDKKLINLTVDDALDYLQHLETTLRNPQSRKSQIALFYEDLRKEEIAKVFRSKSRKAKIRKVWMQPEALLSPKEIKHMISACHTFRDKCILATLYDTGSRINELLNVQLKDVILKRKGKKYRYLLNIRTSKIAGNERTITLFESAKFLNAWLANHPNINDKEAYLFPSRYNPYEPISKSAVDNIIRYSVKASGIKKPNKINCHLFRHSRTTHLFRLGLSEHAIKKRHGWSRASNITSRYTSLSDTDANDMFLQTFGEKPQEKEMLDTDLGQPLGEIEIEDSKDILLRKLLLDPTIQQILGARKTDDGRLIIELED